MVTLLLLGSPEVRHAGQTVRFATSKALAQVALARQAWAEARERLCVGGLREALDERLLAEMQAIMGDDTFARAWSEGEALARGEATGRARALAALLSAPIG